MLLLKGSERWPGSGSPEPGGVGRIQPLFLPLHIDRVVGENIITLHHHLPQHRVLGKIFPDPPGQDIVGRGQLHHSALLPDQQMAVAGACIELVSVPSQPFLQSFDQNRRIPGADLPRAVIQDPPVLIVVFFLGQGHHIAAE